MMNKPVLPTLEAIKQARLASIGIIQHTPLISLHESFKSPDIYLKLETFQTIGSFKIRGIFNAVSKLPENKRAKGLSTVSAGNTAQALSWTARHYGVKARSLMPDSAPKSKIEAVRAYGGEAILVPVDKVFSYLQNQSWKNEAYAFIHPWTDINVMTGHGTLGLEILDDLKTIDSVFIPVGGGGLFSGVGAAIKAIKPSVRLVAVESEDCPAFHASLEAGKPVSVNCNTMCDGVAVPYMTKENFPRIQQLVDKVELVSELKVKSTIQALALNNKLIAEGSGALAVAAALQEHPSERGCSVCIVTGASIDSSKLIPILKDPSLSLFE